MGWNYHWAGVVLKDGGDNLTLESAGGNSIGSVGKTSWWMDLYGTRDVDQTFKKRIHQVHVTRNLQAVGNADAGPDTEEALQELEAQELVTQGWTDLDADQD